jgi:hypothetical protein
MCVDRPKDNWVHLSFYQQVYKIAMHISNTLVETLKLADTSPTNKFT